MPGTPGPPVNTPGLSFSICVVGGTMGALTTATRVPTWHRAGGGHHHSVTLCPQVPLFIFCKTDNHGPQELPAGPMDRPWAGVRGKHGPNRVKSGVTILEIASHSAKNRAKCGAQRERHQTPTPSSQHHGGRWGAGLGGAGAGTMQAVTSGGAPWGSAALRSHDGSAACAGRQGQRAITAPDAGWKAQPLRSTRGAAAGCWQVEGVPRGPGGTRRPRTPAATGTYGARCRQKARVRSGWTPGCLAGREMCRPGGHSTVVRREAPHPLWTHPSTVFPWSRAPPSGKPCKGQSETGCSPGGWARAPHLGADGGGAPRSAGHALPPGAPVYLL